MANSFSVSASLSLGAFTPSAPVVLSLYPINVALWSPHIVLSDPRILSSIHFLCLVSVLGLTVQ